MGTPTQHPDEPLPPNAASGEPENPVPPPEHPAPDEDPGEEPVTPEQLPLPFPLEVAAVIANYRPTFQSREEAIGAWLPRFARPEDSADLEVVLPAVREWVTATTPQTVKLARTVMHKTTYYALWGWRTTGTVRPDVLLIPDNIEHYIHVVNEAWSSNRKNNARTILRRVARAVNPDDWPLRPLAIGSRHVKPPYTPQEERRILSIASLPGRRDRLARMTVVFGSLGAAMSAVEMSLLRPEHLHEMRGGGVAVAVGGHQPRLVPVRGAYTDLAREALEEVRERGVDRFLYGKSHIASETAYRLLGDRRTTPDSETFSVRRARNTWLTAHLRAGTPIPVLRKFSGRLSQRTLDVLGQLVADDLDPWQAAQRGLGA